MTVVETFARLLKHHRVGAGLSQERLGELAGVSADAISALERGARRAPYKATLDLLIAALALDDTARHEIEAAASAARARRPQVPRLDRPPNNLSPQITSFVGRDRDVADIKERLQSHRFVTLVGTGGCGKTRCAIEVARGVLDEYEHGVWFVELATTSDQTLIDRLIARTLGVQETPGRSTLETLLVFLKHKRMLLVLDNCEHVIDEARKVVAAILQACSEVRILATSRENFSIAGEQSYRVPSLPVPSAMQLFCDRAVSADHQFALALESAPHVAEICRRLDGIPLAIELAAARITVLSPQQLAQKLGERFRVLTAGDRSAMPRHRTMRALIDWSYDLLSERERRIFRRLSVFSADFTLESAAALGGDDIDEIAVLDVLSSLVHKSLVQTEPSANTRRYRLLESTREYAREKLIQAGEDFTAARDHARTFLALAEQLRDDWETTPDPVWLARAEPELSNFRTALGWALSTEGDVQLGQRLTAALQPLWRFFGTEGRQWVRAAQQSVDAGTPAVVLASLDLAESQLAAAFTEYKASLIAGERALTRFRELADAAGIAQAELRVGLALIYLDQVTEGETIAARALQANRALGARRSVARALQVLAVARQFAGDRSGSRQRFAEALTAARAAGALRASASIALNLAEAEFRNGDESEALRLATEGLAVFRAVGAIRGVAISQYNIAAYLVALRRFEEARASAREALTVSRDAQFSVGVAVALQHLAAIGTLDPKANSRDLEACRSAARILGYVDARLTALGAAREYTEQHEYDTIISALHDRVGKAEVANLLAEGACWNEDRAVDASLLT